MTSNREYKDSHFSWLFGNPDTMRDLYGALLGVVPPPDPPIVIVLYNDAAAPITPRSAAAYVIQNAAKVF